MVADDDNGAVRDKIPATIALLCSLEQLGKAAIVITAIIVVLNTTIYASLKLGEYADLYTTHRYQYNYLLSAVYLKSTIPAVCIYFLFIISMCMVL